LLTTRLCLLLGIEHPVIQGPLGGPFEIGPELVAAVSNAGGLGSIATTVRTPDQVRADIAAVRQLTGDRPFAVNVTRRPLDEAIVGAVLEEGPAVLSLALGDPGDLVQRAHEAGCLFMEQVTTVRQAVEAADAGVDVMVAQGGEGGGFSGSVGTLALVPQVVDAVAPIPVVAAGGITDGRGLAAALMLGAEGVNVGTRFLASAEARVSDEWKLAVIRAEAEDAVKVDFAEHLVPRPSEGGWLTVPRALRTTFIDTWLGRASDVAPRADELGAELMTALGEGRAHEYLPLAGQSAGGIHEILPAAEIVRGIVTEAEQALARFVAVRDEDG
jgi:enoyl-[acyl-carrier protein] reductase II